MLERSLDTERETTLTGKLRRFFLAAFLGVLGIELPKIPLPWLCKHAQGCVGAQLSRDAARVART